MKAILKLTERTEARAHNNSGFVAVADSLPVWSILDETENNEITKDSFPGGHSRSLATGIGGQSRSLATGISAMV